MLLESPDAVVQKYDGSCLVIPAICVMERQSNFIVFRVARNRAVVAFCSTSSNTVLLGKMVFVVGRFFAIAISLLSKCLDSTTKLLSFCSVL